MVALIAALVVLVPRVPSNAAAVGAGIACGGTLGNLISLLVWSQGVPDPLVVHGWSIRLRNLPFARPDLYEFRLVCDGEVLAREPVRLRETP